MFKYFKALALMIVLLSTPLTAMHAKAEADVTINSLIENAKKLDGSTLTVQGEVIGERLERGSYVWVNINDGTNAIGIWMKKETSDKIKNYGNYKKIGDTITVTGEFHRACTEHGGEADLHCISMKITGNGHPVKEHISFIKIVSATVILLTTIIIFLIYKKKKKDLYNETA